jgi:hypothetical protein
MLTVGVNSWQTLSQANSYFATRYGAVSIWPSLSIADREALLITAFKWIEGQTLFSIDPTDTSDIIKQAQCEAAWYWYKYGEEGEKRQALYAQGVRSFNISGFSETLAMPEFPVIISGMLSGFLTGMGGNLFDIDRTMES